MVKFVMHLVAFKRFKEYCSAIRNFLKLNKMKYGIVPLKGIIFIDIDNENHYHLFEI